MSTSFDHAFADTSDRADNPAQIPSAFDRFSPPQSGDTRQPAGECSEVDEGNGGKAEAARIIQSIGHDFVALRQKGRSPAWAELEDRLMSNAHILISAGMLSPKDWIGMSIDIEEFRKQEQGTQVLPADFIANWLSTPESTAEPIVVRTKKTGKKAKKN